jgi:hypothetical protein
MRIWSLVVSLILLAATPAVASSKTGRTDVSSQKDQAPDESLPGANSDVPYDLFEVHQAIDKELRGKTGKGMLEIPYTIQWLDNEAKVLFKNPSTGQSEMLKVERVAGCC